MVKSTTVSITPATHADRHSVGGDDPLVNPLLLHASRHETGGDDEVHTATFPNSVAFDATSPNTWTDLDLSSIVGSNTAFVLLSVANGYSAGYSLAVRRKGDTAEYAQNIDHPAASAFGLCAGNTSIILPVTTDSDGIIQWKCSAAYATTITIPLYIK